LVTVCGVDDQNIDSGVEQGLCPNRHIAVDPDCGANHEPTFRVKGRPIQSGAERMPPGHDAEQLAVLNKERYFKVSAAELIEDLRRRGLRCGSQHIPGHHCVDLGKSVYPRCLGLTDCSQRLAIFYDYGETVCPFGDQREGFAHRGVRGNRDRRVVDRVRPLHLVNYLGNDIGRDVLRKDRDSTAPCHCLSHPTPRNRGHIGHDDRQGSADPIGTGEVDI
jgi:hypothetical protein